MKAKGKLAHMAHRAKDPRHFTMLILATVAMSGVLVGEVFPIVGPYATTCGSFGWFLSTVFWIWSE